MGKAFPSSGPAADLSGKKMLCCALRSFPNLKSVRELILKRGQAKIKDKTVPLTDNRVIEEHLGECCCLALGVGAEAGVSGAGIWVYSWAF